MEIFLLIFFLIIVIEFIVFIIMLSDIEIEARNCDLSYVEKTLDNFKFKRIDLMIKLSFLGKYLIFACLIDENNINFWKLKFKHRFSGNLERDFFTGINNVRVLTKKYEKICINVLKPKIENIDMYSALGMPEHMMTIYALPIFSCYLSFKFRDFINKYNVEKIDFEVIPRYLNKLYFKMIFSFKIKIKLANLIKFLIIVKFKNK